MHHTGQFYKILEILLRFSVGLFQKHEMPAAAGMTAAEKTSLKKDSSLS
jgi:hypothetical protein